MHDFEHGIPCPSDRARGALRRRKTAGIFAILLLLVVPLPLFTPFALTGCAAAPTSSMSLTPVPTVTRAEMTPSATLPPSTSTPAPTFTPTSTPVPTPSPVPRYTLNQSVLPYLALGTYQSYVMGLAGHFMGDDGPFDTVYHLEGGGYVVLAFRSPIAMGQDWRQSVDSITIVDSTGTTVHTIPDRPQDFDVLFGQLGFTKDGLTMAIRSKVRISDIQAALGEPLSDVSTDRTEYEIRYWHRTMKYNGLEIGISQLFDATDKDIYQVEYLDSTCTDLVSPCGWRIGMTAAEAVKAAEPFDWFQLPKLGPDGKLAELDIVIADFYGYGENAVITFVDDIATSIHFTWVSVGS
jgi:hypothetical protein